MSASSDRIRLASWAERSATFVVFLSLGVLIGAWAAALPAIKLKLGLSDSGLSLALFALSIGSVLASVVAGFAAPRLGTGRATGLGALAVVFGFILPPLAGSLVQFAAAAFMVGATIGTLDVAVNGHAGDIEQRWGGPIMSSFHGAFSLGGLAGAALGGVIAWAGWGVEGQMWIPAALAGFWNLLALPYLGHGPARQTGSAGMMRPTRAMLGLCAMIFLCFVIEGAMADWSAVYLSSVAGSSLAAAATGYAAFSVTMAVGRLGGDWVMGRYGSRLVVTAGGVLAAAGIALAVAFPEPLAATLGFALVGLGAANIVPAVFSAAGRVGNSPASGMAVVATVGYAGFLSGPPLIGSIATLAGLRFALGCLVAAAAVTVLAGLLAFRPGRHDG